MINYIIKEIDISIKNECYLSALALALTLPDICGKVEYPELKTTDRYKKWSQLHLCQYEAPLKGNEEENDIEMPYLNEDILYSLRCSILYEGTIKVDKSKISENRCKVD